MPTIPSSKRPFSYFGVRVKSEFRNGKGSARVPRASSGVAPELSSPTLPGISRKEKFAGRCFRRDAENYTPEACAPRNTPLRPLLISEFGLSGAESRHARRCAGEASRAGVRCRTQIFLLRIRWGEGGAAG